MLYITVNSTLDHYSTGYWEHLIAYNNTECLTIAECVLWKVNLPPVVNH